MTKEKIHTTNYFNTFIEVADDTKATCGKMPESKSDKKTIAEMQYELLANHPYRYTSDDIIFKVFALRNDLTDSEQEQAMRDFFSKGQPCFRSSPLTKTYGFGVHANGEAKVAVFGMETEQYQRLLNDPDIKKVKAMRTSKK